MKQQLFCFVTMLVLVVCSCSGDDNAIVNQNNTSDTSQLIGKWVIFKAEYEGEANPTIYEISGECGREVLEFTTDGAVSETIYIDDNCGNGAGTDWEWWVIHNNTFGMGYSNSETFKQFSVNGTELILDGWNDWGYRKYYQKVN